MDGPAIKMDPADHKLTTSYGNSPEAKAYRAKQEALLREGKLNDAIQMDVNDIRSRFGSKYDLSEKGTDLFFYSKTVWQVGIRVKKINLSPFLSLFCSFLLFFASQLGAFGKAMRKFFGF